MEAAAREFGALNEATVFLNHFKDLPDPLVIGAKVMAVRLYDPQNGASQIHSGNAAGRP
jgi:hypothetical protein